MTDDYISTPLHCVQPFQRSAKKRRAPFSRIQQRNARIEGTVKIYENYSDAELPPKRCCTTGNVSSTATCSPSRSSASRFTSTPEFLDTGQEPLSLPTNTRRSSRICNYPDDGYHKQKLDSDLKSNDEIIVELSDSGDNNCVFATPLRHGATLEGNDDGNGSSRLCEFLQQQACSPSLSRERLFTDQPSPSQNGYSKTRFQSPSVMLISSSNNATYNDRFCHLGPSSVNERHSPYDISLPLLEPENRDEQDSDFDNEPIIYSTPVASSNYEEDHNRTIDDGFSSPTVISFPPMVLNSPPHTPVFETENEEIESESSSPNNKLLVSSPYDCRRKGVTLSNNNCSRSPSQHLIDDLAMIATPTIDYAVTECADTEEIRGNDDLLRFSATPQAPLRPRYRSRRSLQYGILTGNCRIVEDAVALGDDPNLEIPLKNNQRELPLLLAAQKAHAAIVQRLLDAGAVVNSVNHLGQTALHMVCKSRNPPGHEKSCSSTIVDTVSSSSPSKKRIPELWLGLKKFLDEVVESTGMENNGTSISDFTQPNNNENDIDNTHGVYNSHCVRTAARSTTNSLVSNDFTTTTIHESDVILTAKVLICSGIDVGRIDLLGKTAIHYARASEFKHLKNLLSDVSHGLDQQTRDQWVAELKHIFTRENLNHQSTHSLTGAIAFPKLIPIGTLNADDIPFFNKNNVKKCASQKRCKKNKGTFKGSLSSSLNSPTSIVLPPIPIKPCASNVISNYRRRRRNDG